MWGRVESEEEGDEIGRRKAGKQKVENPEGGSPDNLSGRVVCCHFLVTNFAGRVCRREEKSLGEAQISTHSPHHSQSAATSTMMTSSKSSYRSIYTLLTLLAYLLFIGLVSATDEEGTEYLEEKSKEAGVITLPSGLRYKVLEKGEGTFHPTVGSPCLCHYGKCCIWRG